MKTVLKPMALLVATLMTLSVTAQSILIADNNPGAVAVSGAVFVGATALADAITSASDDDIIQVIRSTSSYGTVTIDKRLNIFGIGLFPDTDGTSRSIVTQVTITDPAASGTRISGLVITSVLNLGGVAGALSNLLIENGEILRIQHASSGTTLNNIIIRNNILGNNIGITPDETIDLLAGFVSNVVIANNIIYGTVKNNGVLPNPVANEGAVTADQSTLENNIFVHPNNLLNGSYAFESLTNSVVKNNIFYGTGPQGKTSLLNNTFENNLSFSIGATEGFLTSGGNISTNNIVNQDPLFENVPVTNSPGSLTIFNANLKTGSPAIGAGTGTPPTDMGVYGGPIPFSLEGTLIPTIQELDVPSMVIEGNTLKVHVKAKGN